MNLVNNSKNASSHFSKNKADWIIEELRRRGLKATNQRRIIIHTIVDHNFSCCKEIFYKVKEQDPSIGIATVYRMIKMLEEMGMIDRKKLFQINQNLLEKKNRILLMEDSIVTELPQEEWFIALQGYLKKHGLINNHDISVIIKKTEASGRESKQNG